jgi:hypothetical protein
LDKRQDYSELQIFLANIVRQEVKVLNELSALRTVAQTVHLPMPFEHGGWIIEEKLFTALDFSDREKLQIPVDAAVRLTGMIDVAIGIVRINITIVINLQRITFLLTKLDGFQEIQLASRKPEYDLSFRKSS